MRAGWDQYEGEIDPKTEKGRTHNLVIELLETLLIEHPFNSNTVHNRARRAWKAAHEREGEEGTIAEHERIRPIGLPDCRHTAVSHMLDAGITIDKVSKFIGHSSITVTIDRYGHLLPGGVAEAAEILAEYQARRHQRRTPVTV